VNIGEKVVTHYQVLQGGAEDIDIKVNNNITNNMVNIICL
jgi:hypothetical protein